MMRVDLWINEDPYNAWAVAYFGSVAAAQAARNADPDGDRLTNEQEFLAGSDPTNGSSALRLSDFSRAQNGTSFSLTWQSVSGKTYQVETSVSLTGGQWTSLGDPVTATGPTASLTVQTSAVEAHRFFPVRVLP